MINGETHSLRKKKYRHRKKTKAKQKKTEKLYKNPFCGKSWQI